MGKSDSRLGTAGYTAILVLLLMLVAQDTRAFDGHRKGFVLGFGVGAGAIDVEKVIRYRTIEDDLYGVYTDLTLGWAVSNRVLVHYAGRQQFSAADNGWYLGFPGLGVSYFTREQAPSLVLMAGVGIMLGLGVESVGTGSAWAVGSGGPYVGIGYEWSKNFAVEFCFSRSLDSLRDMLEADHDIYWFSLSVHYLAY